jgi:Flp pilus assembly secretin CpaC
MMMRYEWIPALAALALLAPAPAAAQEKPAAQSAQTKPAASGGTSESQFTPLKMTVVIARYQGDKKISSLPYAFGVTANGKTTSVRLGTEVPMIARAPKGDVAPTFHYRSVGTDIDCTAQRDITGAFNLNLTVEDSSIHLDSAQKPSMPAVVQDIPSFRTFRTSFQVQMKDGQTIQHTSAADPVTGEVVRIDLTLNVVK